MECQGVYQRVKLEGEWIPLCYNHYKASKMNRHFEVDSVHSGDKCHGKVVGGEDELERTSTSGTGIGEGAEPEGGIPSGEDQPDLGD